MKQVLLFLSWSLLVALCSSYLTHKHTVYFYDKPDKLVCYTLNEGVSVSSTVYCRINDQDPEQVRVHASGQRDDWQGYGKLNFSM